MLHLGKSRLDLYLREIAKDQFRWFHADGAPTVIGGETAAQAVAVARLVWRDLRLLPQHQLQQMQM